MSVLFSSRNYSTGTLCFGAVSGSLTGLARLGSANWLDFPNSEAVTFAVDAGHLLVCAILTTGLLSTLE